MPILATADAFLSEHHALEGLLLRLLTVLLILIAGSLGFGSLFRKWGQPKEVGEILAGVLLGPSLVGRLFPEAYQVLLTAEVKENLSILSQIGLIFLMLLIGSEFDFSELNHAIRGAVAVATVGIVVPFALTLIVAPLFVSGLAIPEAQALPFSLLLATAVSITSMPIMGRILRTLSLTRTRIGLLSITAAAIDDVLGWVILGGAIGMIGTRVDGRALAMPLLWAALLAGAMFALGRFGLRRLTASRYAAGLPPVDFALLIGLAVLLAIATNAIGIFSVLGGFLAGVAVSFNRPLAQALEERLHDFVSIFFLPIFFMFSGLKTDIRGMGTDPSRWKLFGLLMLVAWVGKLVPCSIAARLSGMSSRDALAVGMLMNTRALMALVVINIGYDLKVFPDTVFFMLVTMALLTTVVTTPILRRLLRTS